MGPARTVSRENPAGVDPRAVAPIMRADTAKLPADVGVDLSTTGYGIYKVSTVIQAEALDDNKLRSSHTGLARQEGREAYEAFTAALRSRANIQVNEANLAKRER